MLDTSFWINNSPGIRITRSDRNFYNKFPYKMVVDINGSTLWAIRYATDKLKIVDLKSLQSTIIRQLESYNKKVTFNRKTGILTFKTKKNPAYLIQQPNNVQCMDTIRLWKIIEYHLDNKNTTRLSSLKTHIAIFSTSLSDLKKLAEDLHLNGVTNLVYELCTPNDGDLDNILAGKIITNKAKFYKYRINFRSVNKYSFDERTAILKFLEAHHESDPLEIEIPGHARTILRGLNLPTTSSNVYIFCNDENLHTFLQIIKPRCISSIKTLALPA